MGNLVQLRNQITFVSQKMQHATLTDTKGYGPAWSIERSVKEQSVKETNKQLDNIQSFEIMINQLGMENKWLSITCINTIPINSKWSRYCALPLVVKWS